MKVSQVGVKVIVPGQGAEQRAQSRDPSKELEQLTVKPSGVDNCLALSSKLQQLSRIVQSCVVFLVYIVTYANPVARVTLLIGGTSDC